MRPSLSGAASRRLRPKRRSEEWSKGCSGEREVCREMRVTARPNYLRARRAGSSLKCTVAGDAETPRKGQERWGMSHISARLIYFDIGDLLAGYGGFSSSDFREPEWPETLAVVERCSTQYWQGNEVRNQCVLPETWERRFFWSRAGLAEHLKLYPEIDGYAPVGTTLKCAQ